MPKSKKRRNETWREYHDRVARDKEIARKAEGMSGGSGVSDSALEAERQRFRKANGASGLGGAAKRNTAEYKAREKAHLAKWQAKKTAQGKAVKKLSEAFSKGAYLP